MKSNKKSSPWTTYLISLVVVFAVIFCLAVNNATEERLLRYYAQKNHCTVEELQAMETTAKAKIFDKLGL